MSEKLTNPKDSVGVRKAPITTVSTTALAESAHALAELSSLSRTPLRASAAYNLATSALLGWWEGAECFPLPNQPAIPTCIAALMLLRKAMIRAENGAQGVFEDDRPREEGFEPFYPLLNQHAGRILDQHADKSPRHFTIEDSADGKGSPEVSFSADALRFAPWHLLPAQVLAEVGLAMLEGAAKYGRHNFRNAGVRASVYVDATFRHLNAWWSGEDIDPDSGMSHVTKAITSLTVLRDAQIQGMFADDRAPRAACFWDAPRAPTSSVVTLKVG